MNYEIVMYIFHTKYENTIIFHKKNIFGFSYDFIQLYLPYNKKRRTMK